MATTEGSKTLKESTVVDVARIEHHGTSLILPENMTIDGAIKLLQRRLVYDEEIVACNRTYPYFPWDGAVALDSVLTARYGWSPAEPTYSFWGKNPPQLVNIPVGYNETKNVPWGKFKVPGVDGDLYTQNKPNPGGIQQFALSCQVKRKFQKEIENLYEDVAEQLKAHSIYRGKAVRLNFGVADKGGMVNPQFLDTDSIDPDQLIFAKEVEDAVETNVFTPLKRFKDLLRAKIPFKRGVLLTGDYGTGKTLVARVAAYHAVTQGITFVDCVRAQDLALCVEFARMYQEPAAAIFCEDIDRTMEGARTADMDQILNIVDGIDSKSTRIMIVLTTNAVEAINQAMLRPGRLDAVIDVKKPDGPAIERLLLAYGKGVIIPGEDLSRVGEVLSGNIPAVIEEVVKRSKLSALRLTEEGEYQVEVGAEALLDSANTMKMQLDLLQPRPEEVVPTLDKALGAIVEKAVVAHVKEIELTVEKVHHNVYETSTKRLEMKKDTLKA